MGENFCDMGWCVDIDTEDDPDLQRSVVRIYLEEGDASYAKTWWLECGRNKEVLYRIEEFVDVSRECAETIDLEKILQEEDQEELMTLFTDKLLSPFQHLVFREWLKYYAGVLVRRCRDRLIPLVNRNSTSKLYSISLGVSFQLSATLGVKAWNWFLDCLDQLQPDMSEWRDYDRSSPMPLPRIVPDGYRLFQLGGGAKLDKEKTCAICLGKYEPHCLVIRLQCLNELLPDPDKANTAAANPAMLLPCQHIFHANCISNWLRVSNHKPYLLCSHNTCPLCRFEIRSHYFVFSLVHLFPL
ncbi:unnamed protein product [Cuscuta epithymum]|uniref:RING-type E3 ubiquitin transferase n=1 Tax=Cuscuta epithymum TaxID=186058 RepID=A0AAV0GLA0_9ASTE|nr:unnamed protein product [Cuscuta epithymum]